jgi:hypothetical protein
MPKKYIYCASCLKETRTKRKKIDSYSRNIWFFVVLATLGLGLIPLLLYRYIILKKNLCRKCGNKVEFYRYREHFPVLETTTQHFAGIMDEVTKQSEAEKYKYCKFCKEKIEKNVEICSYCGSIQ